MNIMEKIEKVAEKNTLHKIRKILIKEFHNEYYGNVGNLSSQTELFREIRKDTEGNDYFYIESMAIWQNGWVDFHNKNVQTPAQRIKTRGKTTR